MSAPQARELYIYYRVREANVEVAGRAVSTMQRALCAAHPGLATRLLRRPESAAGQQTWMECYEHSGAGVDAALQASIAEAARSLSRWVDGDRHVEVFVEFDRVPA